MKITLQKNQQWGGDVKVNVGGTDDFGTVESLDGLIRQLRAARQWLRRELLAKKREQEDA
ncbi:MAG: hypothetical protein JO051_03230 [Acidobacteriaceae bacterium]|nr:hypothetical protein [Acidobacteriaceae bacterium]